MLAINKIVLLVIFLIVLALSFIILFGLGKGTSDQLLLQHELRQCCGVYRAYNCTADPTTIDCNDNTIDDIRIKLNITSDQLKNFCNCWE